jgi:hypothetical protein
MSLIFWFENIENQSVRVFIDAATIAKMPARIAGASRCQAAITDAKSGSIFLATPSKTPRQLATLSQPFTSPPVKLSSSPVLKTGWPARVTGVRIPPPPWPLKRPQSSGAVEQ